MRAWHWLTLVLLLEASVALATMPPCEPVAMLGEDVAVRLFSHAPRIVEQPMIEHDVVDEASRMQLQAELALHKAELVLVEIKAQLLARLELDVAPESTSAQLVDRLFTEASALKRTLVALANSAIMGGQLRDVGWGVEGSERMLLVAERAALVIATGGQGCEALRRELTALIVGLRRKSVEARGLARGLVEARRRTEELLREGEARLVDLRKLAKKAGRYLRLRPGHGRAAGKGAVEK